MSLSYRLALAGMALANAVAPAEIELVNRPVATKPKPTSGNPSCHTPHQGKREMERRAKRMKKEPRT
jgi:hypothetical protein